MEQIIVFSLMISALYALVAMGFTMIFGVAGILNLAHGAFIMVSAYTAFVSQSFFHLDLYTSFAVAVGFTTLVAVAFYEGIHRFARLILSLAIGVGIYLGLMHFLETGSYLWTLITATFMGAAGTIASLFIGRRAEGLVALAVIVTVGYLGALTLLTLGPILAAVSAATAARLLVLRLFVFWIGGLFVFWIGLFFFWLVAAKQKLKWEHAIFFPIATAVFSWAHFTMGKPVFESLLTGIPVGLLFTVGLVRYIQQSPVITLIVTLAMALLIEQLVIIFFRYDVQLLPPFIEGSIDVHGATGALLMAIGEAIFFVVLLGLWAYQLLAPHVGRGRVVHWLLYGTLFLAVEHGFTLLLAGRFEPETAANIASFFIALAILLSTVLAFGIYRLLTRYESPNLLVFATFMDDGYSYFIALLILLILILWPNALAQLWPVELSIALLLIVTRYFIGSIERARHLLLPFGLGLGLLIEQIAFLYYAWDAQSIYLIFGPARAFTLNLIKNRLVLFVVSAIIIGLFWFFVQRTRTGKAILATSMDQEGAALVGIDVRRIYTLTWALSGALAGVAGVFLAAWLPMLPIMWRDPLIISFAIVVLGGLGSLKGSLLAAVMIGFVETLTAYTNPIHITLNQPSNPFEQPYAFDLLGLSWVGVPSLIILILILFLRPKGLFGREFE